MPLVAAVCASARDSSAGVRRLLVVACFALAAALLGLLASGDVTVATHAITPLPLNSNPASTGDYPDIATDGAGNWVAAWRSMENGSPVAVSRSTDGGQTWNPYNLIPGSGTAISVSIATDNSGTWILAFDASADGVQRKVYFSVSVDNGLSWTSPTAFPFTTNDQRDAKVKFGDGVWVVVWEESYELVYARSTDGGVTWSSPAPVGPPSSQHPDLATDGAGNWVVVWVSTISPGGCRVSTSRSADGAASWAAQSIVADTPCSGFPIVPSITTDGAGTWMIAFESGSSVTDYDIYRAASTDIGGSWSGAVEVNASSDTVGDDTNPSIVSTGAGQWTVVWQSTDTLGDVIGADSDILAAGSTDNGATWSGPGIVNGNAASDPFNNSDETVATASGGSGDWITVWDSSDFPGTILYTDCPLSGSDPDADAVWDVCDNCPNAANGNQLDTNGDAIGDVCDPDDDGDGVLDEADACALTALGLPVDLSGCADAQVDADSDGVCNPGAPSGGPSACTGADSCAGTASGAPVDSVGCSDAQVDPDVDGVCSPRAGGPGPSGCTGIDLCPATPSGTPVDAAGCSDAQADTDADGVCDVLLGPSAGPSAACAGLDGCPNTPAAEPVTPAGCADADVDPDLDGICTPLGLPPGPAGCAGADNCPLAANPGQEDANANGIGDACEAPGAPGDSDGDGWMDAAEAGMPLCSNSVNDDNHDDGLVNDGCPAFGTAESNCLNATDDDGDGPINDGCARNGTYAEGQFNIGTNNLARCGVGLAAPSPSWPADFNSSTVPTSVDKITLIDLTSFLGPVRRLGTSPDVVPSPNSEFNARWDLIPGKSAFSTWISINDLTALLGGPTGFPPMYAGNKIFGGPTCTAHPVYGD